MYLKLLKLMIRLLYSVTDLEGQNLHSIKWFKGRHEFYRYAPGDYFKKKIFLVMNLDVDVRIIEINDVFITSIMLSVFQIRKSDEHTVFLKNLHPHLNGTYTCEVTVDETYEVVTKEANMSVR